MEEITNVRSMMIPTLFTWLQRISLSQGLGSLGREIIKKLLFKEERDGMIFDLEGIQGGVLENLVLSKMY